MMTAVSIIKLHTATSNPVLGATPPRAKTAPNGNGTVMLINTLNGNGGAIAGRVTP
jgi:hypothetical protein